MTLFKCKECGQEFETEKSLHGHFRKHKMTVADYYLKYFPRFDLYTHSPIKFKTPSQYLNSDFNSSSNFRKWSERENPEVVKDYLLKKTKNKIEEKGLPAVMGQVQLDSYGWPNVRDIKKLFGSYGAFCEKIGYPPQFGFPMTKKFYEDHTDKLVWVDTREQKPLNFINPVKLVKLDCGDYTMGGDDFQNTFVDRKSAKDFIGTFGAGLERFKREMERCASIGAYLFIVVDSTMAGVARSLAFSPSRTNIQHILHNMREVLNEFHGDCQFVFSGGRENSALLIPKILACGKDLWKVDVQYFIEEDDEWLGT